MIQSYKPNGGFELLNSRFRTSLVTLVLVLELKQCAIVETCCTQSKTPQWLMLRWGLTKWFFIEAYQGYDFPIWNPYQPTSADQWKDIAIPATPPFQALFLMNFNYNHVMHLPCRPKSLGFGDGCFNLGPQAMFPQFIIVPVIILFLGMFRVAF